MCPDFYFFEKNQRLSGLGGYLWPLAYRALMLNCRVLVSQNILYSNNVCGVMAE